MANPEFEGISDETLKLLFSDVAGVQIEGEALDILHELSERGYWYDIYHRDFLTCEEWNVRYSTFPPVKCD